jgi:hypothetical protein
LLAPAPRLAARGGRSSWAAQVGFIEERIFVTAITGGGTHLKNDA